MGEPLQAGYEVEESIINEIHALCDDIISPKVAYRRNQLEMANDVISSNSLLADTIKSILDGIRNS